MALIAQSAPIAVAGGEVILAALATFLGISGLFSVFGYLTRRLNWRWLAAVSALVFIGLGGVMVYEAILYTWVDAAFVVGVLVVWWLGPTFATFWSRGASGIVRALLRGVGVGVLMAALLTLLLVVTV